MPQEESVHPISSNGDRATCSNVDANELPQHAPLSASDPKRIGQYQIRRFIAAGAMGAVYEAAQEKPRRIVAVKVMKQGIASRTALRRFEYESQLLARLHHPGIAEVYEAGAYDDGSGEVPFFAMEYIRNAKRITEYVREKKLGFRERMALFVDVCEAVEHGHRKGIIHRDLKPANILVDSHGKVKVIDFGVARATDSDMAVTTLQTDVGQLVGTLQYMSPEQCEADPNDLDARSDVYGLGVVLYELLCGRLPYDLTGMLISVATRVIRQVRPPKPSVTDSRLRGDVETIVLKSLEKERDRRYRSAGDLGDDLRRCLANEPIHAHPPSVIYHVRKFARRNRLLFGAVAVAAFALAAGLAASTVLYFRAVASRAEAEAVTAFITGTLSSVDPYLSRGPDVTVRQVLDDAAERLPGAFASHPLIEATLHRTIGNSYRAIAQYEAAQKHLREALAIHQRELGDETAEAAESLDDLAQAVYAQSPNESASLHRRALAIRRKLFGDDHPAVAQSLNNLAGAIFQLGQYPEAESCLRDALDIRRKLYGADHRDVADTLNNLGAVLQARGRPGEARPLHLEALAIRRRVLSPEHIGVAFSLNNLGGCAEQLGDQPAAEQYYRDALAISRTVADNRHPLGIEVLGNLARALHKRNDLDGAESILREALLISRDMFGEDHADTGQILTRLGACLRDKGDYAEAKTLSRRALDIHRRQTPMNDEHISATLETLATTFYATGEYAAAEPLFRELLDLQRRPLGENGRETALTLSNLGAALNKLDKLPEAEETLRKAVEQTHKTWGDGDWHTGNTRSHYGDCLRKIGRLNDAEHELSEGYRILSTARGPNDSRTREAAKRLAEVYDARGDDDAARKYRDLASPTNP